ncbi:hypothetical protein niasHT_038219 [Heterodera trifolii]|uniref:Large ribosomal subunit protein P2 n=1 Tax=Heterodera trifolii TaxID=157864 RepID=A0ABD2J6Q5_9BILA
MKYVAAFMLASLGGNGDPSPKDLEKILAAGGLEVDMDNVKAVINAVKGKSIEDVIAAGQKKLATMPTGGGAAAPTATAAAAAAPVAAEKKEEKKKEEVKEESDDDMGFGLFD